MYNQSRRIREKCQVKLISSDPPLWLHWKTSAVSRESTVSVIDREVEKSNTKEDLRKKSKSSLSITLNRVKGMNQRKIVVVGESQVGKTSLIRSYFGVHEFEEEYSPTTTSDFFSTTLTIDGTEISGSIWDIGRKSMIGRSFMRDTHGVMLVVDVSDTTKLLDGLDQTYDDVVKLAGFADDSFPCHVVANKSDLVTSDHDLADAKTLIDNWCSGRRATPIAYTIASAKTKVGVEVSITSLFRLTKDYEPRIAKLKPSSTIISPAKAYESAGTLGAPGEPSIEPTRGEKGQT